jgi:hypothetical protein
MTVIKMENIIKYMERRIVSRRNLFRDVKITVSGYAQVSQP